MSDASRSPQGATGGSAVPPHPYKNKAIGARRRRGGRWLPLRLRQLGHQRRGRRDRGRVRDRSRAVTGLVVAIALLGCAFGAWLGGKLADRWGRTKVMFLGAVLFFVSSILSGLAIGVWDLVLWRVMAGIGIGIASVIAPAYIAEIAPAAMRGRLGSLQQLAITLGIFAALLSDQLLRDVGGRRVGGAVARASRRGAGCSSSPSSPPPCTASSRSGSRSRPAT